MSSIRRGLFPPAARRPFPTERKHVRLVRWGPPPLRCPICRKVMTTYVNLARHMTRTADMYAQHIKYVERITGKGFLEFAVGNRGITNLAAVLEGKKPS